MTRYWTTDGSYYTENKDFIINVLLKEIYAPNKQEYTLHDGNGEIIALATIN